MNSPLPLFEADKVPRAHAIVEQVNAGLRNGPLAHLLGHFWANSAWLVWATMAFNLTHAANLTRAAATARFCHARWHASAPLRSSSQPSAAPYRRHRSKIIAQWFVTSTQVAGQ